MSHAVGSEAPILEEALLAQSLLAPRTTDQETPLALAAAGQAGGKVPVRGRRGVHTQTS